ncbi:CBS domain-containing protein [Acidobacteriota bacterium]
MSLNAKDIMRSPVVCADTKMSVSDLIKLLREYGISGAPVLDDKGRLTGVVSGSDVVSKCGIFCDKVIPDHDFKRLPPFPEVTFSKGFHVEEYADSWVTEIMSSDVVAASPETPLETLVDLMLTWRIHRIPIIEDDRPVGIVSSFDLLPFLEHQKTDLIQ